MFLHKGFNAEGGVSFNTVFGADTFGMHLWKRCEVHESSDNEVHSQEHEGVEEVTEHVPDILVLGLISEHVQDGYIVLNIIIRQGVNSEQYELKGELPCEDKGKELLEVGFFHEFSLNWLPVLIMSSIEATLNLLKLHKFDLDGLLVWSLLRLPRKDGGNPRIKLLRESDYHIDIPAGNRFIALPYVVIHILD